MTQHSNESFTTTPPDTSFSPPLSFLWRLIALSQNKKRSIWGFFSAQDAHRTRHPDPVEVVAKQSSTTSSTVQHSHLDAMIGKHVGIFRSKTSIKYVFSTGKEKCDRGKWHWPRKRLLATGVCEDCDVESHGRQTDESDRYGETGVEAAKKKFLVAFSVRHASSLASPSTSLHTLTVLCG